MTRTREFSLAMRIVIAASCCYFWQFPILYCTYALSENGKQGIKLWNVVWARWECVVSSTKTHAMLKSTFFGSKIDMYFLHGELKLWVNFETFLCKYSPKIFIMQDFIEYFLTKFQVNFSLKPRIELEKDNSLLKYDQIWVKMWSNQLFRHPKMAHFIV